MNRMGDDRSYSGLVQKYIGTAYDKVAAVSAYLDDIRGVNTIIEDGRLDEVIALGPDIDIAAALIAYQGEWDKGHKYDLGESVTYHDALWISTKDGNRSIPEVTSPDWFSVLTPSIGSVRAVTDLPTAPGVVRTVVASGLYGANDGGGGIWLWDDGVTKADADLGVIYDPDMVADIQHQGLGVGLGCWVRHSSYKKNVRWFGAFGNGGHSDGAIIQYVLDRYTRIYLPKGTYLISKTLNISKLSTHISGDDTNFIGEATVLKADSSLTGFVLHSSLHRGGFRMEDLSITGNNSMSAAGGIDIDDADNGYNYLCYLKNIGIIRFNKLNAVGISCAAWGCTFEDVRIRRITRGIGIKFLADIATLTTIVLRRCYLGECDICIHVNKLMYGLTMYDTIMESSSIGLFMHRSNCNMVGTYLESIPMKNPKGTVKSLVLESQGIDPEACSFYLHSYDPSNPSVYGVANLHITGLTALHLGWALDHWGTSGNGIFAKIQDHTGITIEGASFRQGPKHILTAQTVEKEPYGYLAIEDCDGVHLAELRDMCNSGNGHIFGDRWELKGGLIESFGEDMGDYIPRKLGDTHHSNKSLEVSIAEWRVAFAMDTALSKGFTKNTDVMTLPSTAGLLRGDRVLVTYQHVSGYAGIIKDVLDLTRVRMYAPNTVMTMMTGYRVHIWRWVADRVLPLYRHHQSIPKKTTAHLLTFKYSRDYYYFFQVTVAHNVNMAYQCTLVVECLKGGAAALTPRLEIIDVNHVNNAVKSPEFSIVDLPNDMVEIKIKNMDAAMGMGADIRLDRVAKGFSHIW